MSCDSEIHVGDIGTVYRVRALSDGEDFDISTADTLELIFKMPNGIVLHKTGVLGTDGSPTTQWFIEYEVQPGDGIGSPGEFHDNPGKFSFQAFVHFPDGKQWHSNIQTQDSNKQQLRIFPNLD